MNENTAYYEDLRNKVRNRQPGSNADVQNSGKELAESISRVATSVKDAGKGFVTAAEAVEYGSMEAAKLESRAYFTSPSTDAENVIARSGNGLADAINGVAAGVKDAGKNLLSPGRNLGGTGNPVTGISTGVSNVIRSSGGNVNIQAVMMQLKDAVIQLKNEVANTKQIRSDVKAIRKGIPGNDLAFV